MKDRLIFLSIALVVIISNIWAFKMYFWHDDYSVLYFLQQNLNLWFPFQYYEVFIKPLYGIFGLNPFGYHVIAIILYLSATLIFYMLVGVLTKSKAISFFSSLIFASGYVGEEAVRMFVGTGLTIFMGLNFMLLSLLFFANYLKGGKKNIWLYILTLILFSATIEIAPHRYFGLWFLLITFEWVLYTPKRREVLGSIVRGFIFVGFFLVRYLINPIHYFWKYPLSYSGSNPSYLSIENAISLIRQLSINDITNLFGTFGNLFFPSYLQQKLFYVLQRNFRLMPLATPNQLYIVSGVILIILFVLLIVIRYPKNIKVALFSISCFFPLIFLNFLTAPQEVFPSESRYLVPEILVPALTLTIFWKGRENRVGFFLLIWFSIIFSLHLSSAFLSQKEFVQTQSLPARKLYGLLRDKMEVSGKTLIKIEPETQKLSEPTADAMRVGFLDSASAIAVNLKTRKDNILLPDNSEQTLDFFLKDLNGNTGYVYSFVFTGDELRDISQSLREVLTNYKKISLVDNLDWSGSTNYFTKDNRTLGIYPKFKFEPKEKISSQLSLNAELEIRAQPDLNLKFPYYHMHYQPDFVDRPELWMEVLSWRESECLKGNFEQSFECILDKDSFDSSVKKDAGVVEVAWKYDSYGLTGRDRKTRISVSLDSQWHSYNFRISEGGEYLRELSIDYISFPGTLDVRKLKVDYQK